MAVERILVPVDLGDGSEALLDEALDFATKLGAKVTVLHVVEPPAYQYPRPEAQGLTEPGELDSELSRGAARALGTMADLRRSRGVSLDTAVRTGVPWEQIGKFAHERCMNLVVIGTHARRGLARALLGSVAENVIRTVDVPVLTIHGRR
jgi:nucleotide-binding universal stress UspA family protein